MEYKKMAERKKPHVDPVMDNSFGNESDKSISALSKPHFNNLIRYVKRSGLEQALNIRTATHATLKRVGARRDKSKAAQGIPKGSDQVDVGSLITWLNSVTTDKKSIRQVVALDATCCAREN